MTDAAAPEAALQGASPSLQGVGGVTTAHHDGVAPERPRRGRPLAIRVRRARPEDREAVLAFASRTWHGWDYIPRTWTDWLESRDGVVLVALPVVPAERRHRPRDADGRALDPDVPIAMSRVALLSRKEAWLEGIRVDPRVRGRSVATHLQVAELTWAAAHHVAVLRYITGADNEGSHRLAARHDFRLLGAWRGYLEETHDADDEAPPDEQADRSAVDAARVARARLLDDLERLDLLVDRSVDPAELSRLWRLVETDPTFRLGGGLYEARPWAQQTLTRKRFATHVARGEVLVGRIRVDTPAITLAILDRDAITMEDQTLRLSLLVGEPDAAITLAWMIRDRAGSRVGLRLPDPDPPLIRGREAAWRRAGFPPRGHTNHVFERLIRNGPRLPAPDAGGMVTYDEKPRAVAVAPSLTAPSLTAPSLIAPAPVGNAIHEP